MTHYPVLRMSCMQETSVFVWCYSDGTGLCEQQFLLSIGLLTQNGCQSKVGLPYLKCSGNETLRDNGYTTH